MREGFTPSVERPRNYNLQNRTEKEIDPAEELFDDINTDVRRRKKAGENITFKTHERYDEWKALRDANVAESLRADSTKRESEFRNAQEQEAQDDRVAYNARIDAQNSELAAQRAQAQEAANLEAKRLEASVAEEVRRKDLESLSIDRFYRDGKKIDSVHASPEEAGNLLLGKKDAGLSVTGRLVEGGFEGKEAERQIKSIVKDMDQLKNVYSIQINSLEGMGFLDKITGRRSALEKQMAETQAEILVKSEALLKEFKVSGQVFEDQEAIVERLWDLSKKLESKVSLGEAAVALAVLTAVVMGCAGDVSKKVSAADNFRAPAAASYDSHGTYGNANEVQDNTVFDSVEDRVSGYKVTSETVTSSDVADGKVLKETFSLTESEAETVKNFTDWRHKILNPEFIGKLQKDGTIPTTEKGLNVKAGTKVEVTVEGEVKLGGTVKEGGSIWSVLEKLKPGIKKLAAKEKGFGNIDLRITRPFDSEESANKTKGEISHDKKKATSHSHKTHKPGAKVGQADTGSKDGDPTLKELARHDNNDKLGEIGVKHQIGSDYTSPDDYQGAIDELKKIKNGDVGLQYGVQVEIKRLEAAKKDLEHRLDKAKSEAKKYLETNGAKHTMGRDYKAVEDYDKAIVELGQIEEGIVLPAIVDMQQTDESKRIFQVKDGIRTERERLEKAKQNLRLKQIQADIDRESPTPEAGKPEKLDFKPSLKISDLLSDRELNSGVSAGIYGRNLAKAHELTRSVFEYLGGEDQHLLDSRSGEDLRKFQGMVEEAKNLYNLVLTIKEDGKIKPNPTTIEQATKGQEIANMLAAEVKGAIPETGVDKIIEAVSSRLEDLFKKTESRVGNVALYGQDQALEILQKAVYNIEKNGKIGNSDRKILKKVEGIAHTVLHGNNLEPDKNAAKEILNICDILKKAISKRDQNRVEKEEVVKPGILYELPKQADLGNAKDLSKLLPKSLINRVESISGVVQDFTGGSASTVDLNNAAALLEQLFLKPLETDSVKDKVDRVKQTLAGLLEGQKNGSVVLNKKEKDVLNSLSELVGEIDSSLIEHGVLVKEIIKPKEDGRVAKAK